MKVQARIGNLLDQEMDRGEFLGYVGAATLAVLGVTSMLKSLENVFAGSDQQNESVAQNAGYGGSVYGG